MGSWLSADNVDRASTTSMSLPGGLRIVGSYGCNLSSFLWRRGRGAVRCLRLKKKKAEKRSQIIGNQSTADYPPHHSNQPAGAKRGLRILRDQSYKIINKEMVFRSLTGFPRKGDLKISLTGAPWSRCFSNSCRRINELHVHYIKGTIKSFYLVLNHQVISVTTLMLLPVKLYNVMYRFALYRAQRKSEHVFHFPHGSQFVKPVKNATRVL